MRDALVKVTPAEAAGPPMASTARASRGRQKIARRRRAHRRRSVANRKGAPVENIKPAFKAGDIDETLTSAPVATAEASSSSRASPRKSTFGIRFQSPPSAASTVARAGGKSMAASGEAAWRVLVLKCQRSVD